MANSKIPDETIIAALIQHGTVKAAAEAAGISPRAIYSRMQEKEFVALYQAAKTDIVRKAVFAIDSRLAAAVEAVADIVTDKTVNPAIRLQAAQTLFNNAGKFAERLTGEEHQQREINRSGNIFNFDSF